MQPMESFKTLTLALDTSAELNPDRELAAVDHRLKITSQVAGMGRDRQRSLATMFGNVLNSINVVGHPGTGSGLQKIQSRANWPACRICSRQHAADLGQFLTRGLQGQANT